MSDANYKPDGTGVVMGDTKPVPDRGTTTGMTGYATELDGNGLGLDATNSLGSITGATGSDPMEQCYADESRVGGK
jgi:hypothetical protein